MTRPGRILIDRYVLDVLLPDLVGHDKRPAAFLVYLFLWGRSAGHRRRPVPASLATIASETGLSKSAVQRALRWLRRRRLVRSDRVSDTATPEHSVLRPWQRRHSESTRS